MDISNIKYHTTADLLSELILCKMMDTAIGGAIAKELLQRGIDAHDVYVAVRELLAIYAARADGTDEPESNDDELDYCGGLEPGSWCADKEEDHV